jgi:hypothetical protein
MRWLLKHRAFLQRSFTTEDTEDTEFLPGLSSAHSLLNDFGFPFRCNAIVR